LTLEFARLCVWGCRLWSPGSQVLFRLYLACRRCCGCVLQVFYCARHGSREPASMWKLVPAVLQNPLQATPDAIKHAAGSRTCSHGKSTVLMKHLWTILYRKWWLSDNLSTGTACDRFGHKTFLKTMRNVPEILLFIHL
jgi:hypothetical protein